MLGKETIDDGMQAPLFFEEKHVLAAFVYVELKVVDFQICALRCKVLVVVGWHDGILIAMKHEYGNLLRIHPMQR